jgi:hypothetical protein
MVVAVNDIGDGYLLNERLDTSCLAAIHSPPFFGELFVGTIPQSLEDKTVWQPMVAKTRPEDALVKSL